MPPDRAETGSAAVAPETAAAPDANRRLRLLQLAALTSTCDRFSLAPLLVLIGIDLGASLAAVAAVASGYFLAYGLMQPVWGLLSDRIGRVRVMRVALLGAMLGGVGSVLAPNLAVLGVGRVLAGGCFAALIPASLVYVGDTWPAQVRQRPLSDVLAASALGTAMATAGAGLLADLVSWRAVFAVTAVAGGALWFALARLPEPDLEPVTGNPLRPVGRVLRTRWAWMVLLLGFVEGIVVLGALTYLAPALQSLGSSAAVAGLVSGGFGVGALLFSRVVRLLVGRVSPAGLAGIGGGFLAAAWAAPAITVNVPAVLIAGLLLGGSWAFLHSTLQSWATDVVPQARAAAVALFAAVLFFGSSVGTAVAAPAADAGAFGLLFRTALVVAVPLAVVAVLARARYDRRRPRAATEPGAENTGGSPPPA
ncbi:MFS transporter [Pseudonocardia sp. H11422]|uniref:MFS transporter n=1 Tax=Pseudonocardia sp. H11422 TaxID=2835866 RepID=UPI001BDD7428|nr:MFS transporter [Pseudonocardia sp. H11422]